MFDKKYFYPVLFCLIALVYLISMTFIPMMEVDAAQYASISEQMIREHGFLQVRHMHGDYLDKPPLLFWLSSLSVFFLGYSGFAYKLPSVLAGCLAIYATYKYARLHYDREISVAAALILAGCQAFFIIANDCRTDNLLIGFCCLSIWKIAAYLKNDRISNLLVGFVGIGCAMLAKGPLGLIFPVFTIGSMMVGNNYFHKINWTWLWSIPVISVLLAPMCIGLYQQYGLRGLEFYFWTQSFGRITGQSEWANDSGPFFFVHTFLWCFLPFSLIFLIGMIKYILDLFKKNILSGAYDWGLIGGFILTFLALSMSRYKLPHYIYILCPLASVMTAQFLLKLNDQVELVKRLYAGQMIINIALIILSIFLVFYFSPVSFSVFLIACIVLIAGIWYLGKATDLKIKFILYSILAITFVNFNLNALFYPKLLKYQSSSEVAFYIQKKKLHVDHLMAYKIYGHTLSYYLHRDIPYSENVESISTFPPGAYIYTNDQGLADINKALLSFETIETFDDFHVSGLTAGFLNPATRSQTLTKAYLIKLH